MFHGFVKGGRRQDSDVESLGALGKLSQTTPQDPTPMRFLLSLVSSLILSQTFCTSVQIPMPSSGSPNAVIADDVELNADLPTLYDLITIQSRRASIFGDYLRSVADMNTRLADRNTMSTVLLPTNKAVLAMNRKPCVDKDLIAVRLSLLIIVSFDLLQ